MGRLGEFEAFRGIDYDICPFDQESVIDVCRPNPEPHLGPHWHLTSDGPNPPLESGYHNVVLVRSRLSDTGGVWKLSQP